MERHGARSSPNTDRCGHMPNMSQPGGHGLAYRVELGFTTTACPVVRQEGRLTADEQRKRLICGAKTNLRPDRCAGQVFVLTNWVLTAGKQHPGEPRHI